MEKKKSLGRKTNKSDESGDGKKDSNRSLNAKRRKKEQIRKREQTLKKKIEDHGRPRKTWVPRKDDKRAKVKSRR